MLLFFSLFLAKLFSESNNILAKYLVENILVLLSCDHGKWLFTNALHSDNCFESHSKCSLRNNCDEYFFSVNTNSRFSVPYLEPIQEGYVNASLIIF